MKIRLAGAVLVAVALPAAASGAQINPTLRVEGGSANIIPLIPFGVENSAPLTVLVRDTTDPDTIRVSARSATAQVANAASWLGLKFGFDIFNFGGPSSFVTQIGPNKTPASFSPSWRLKVNHKVTPAGSDATKLKATDSVLWSFSRSFDEPELDLRTADQRVAPGSAFRTRVVAFDNDGVPTPGAAASVRFAGVTKTANAKGSVTFDAVRDGAFWASATRTGSVRSQRQLVCVSPAATGRLCSAIAFPKPGGRVTEPHAIIGVVAGTLPNSRVNVALAKIAGAKCRFLLADRRTFSAPQACRNRVATPVLVRPNGTWMLRITAKQPDVTGRLSPGSYRVWSRVVTGTRRETQGTPGINTVSFTVVLKSVYG